MRKSHYAENRITEIKDRRKRGIPVGDLVQVLKERKTLVAHGNSGQKVEVMLYQAGRDASGDFIGMGTVKAEQCKADLMAWIRDQVWPNTRPLVHTLYISPRRRIVAWIPQDGPKPVLWLVGQTMPGERWENAGPGYKVCTLTQLNKLTGRPRIKADNVTEIACKE